MGLKLISKITRTIFGAPALTPEKIREMIDGGFHDQALDSVERIASDTPGRAAVIDSLKGEIYFHARKDAEAKEAFQRALKIQPDLPEAHYGLSLLMSDGFDIYLATKHAQFSVNLRPKNARFQAQLGYCHLMLGNIGLAEAALKRATRLAPENKYAWNNFGIILLRKGVSLNSAACFKKALALDPFFADAEKNLQLALEFTSLEGNAEISLDENFSVDELEASLLERPDDFELVLRLMQAYASEGDLQSGIDAMDAWLARHPGEPLACKALGVAWQKAGEPVKAERLLRVAMEHDDQDVDVIKSLAQSLSKQHRFEEAKSLYLAALEVSPEDQDLIIFHAANLANMCEYDAALEICEKWAKNNSNLSCHAPVLAYLGRFEEAKALFERHIAGQPNEPGMRLLRGSFRLLEGDFAGGWDDYKYRTIADLDELRVLPFPEWNGEPLDGRQIVVLAEQGLGDQIMFSSCLADLLALKPSRVVVELIARVAETVERSFPEVTIVRTRQGNDLSWLQEYPELDYFVHLGDLPRFFRRQLSDFPAHRGYLLADKAKGAMWRRRIDEWERDHGVHPHPRRPRIGLSWRGGAATTRSVIRTLAVENLLPLTSELDATWVCLQYGDVTVDLEQARELGLDMAYWPESIADLDEFSAMIKQLDLVITVCNTTVHYAGALDCPVWVLSPKVPEWRYGLLWDSLPWYPSSKVYRQSVANEWVPLLAHVKQELAAWMARRHVQE